MYKHRSWTTEIIFYYQVIDWNTFSEFQTGKNHETWPPWID